MMNEWEKNYESMKQHFIYGGDSLSFEQLIQRMRELTSRIRKLKNSHILIYVHSGGDGVEIIGSVNRGCGTSRPRDSPRDRRHSGKQN